MQTHNEFVFVGIVLIAWALPVAFAIWLIMSLREIKSVLREIRDELRSRRP